MKPFVSGILFASVFCACSNNNSPIVSDSFIDSLISQYTDPPITRSNDSAILFWKNRINPLRPGLVSESKYAGGLSARFHLFGDIADMRAADSVVRKIDTDYNHKEAAAALTLARYAILQHRFREAETWLLQATKTGIKKYDLLTTSFDVDFELGRYPGAAYDLKQLNDPNDYGYFFRRSKMDHLNGLLDSSIHAMLTAASLEENNDYLKQVALANAGDLYIHAADLTKAASLYVECIRMNSADFHSLTGLGWIALVHDKNDSLAERIFKFVQSKNKLPDAFFRLSQVGDEKGDSLMRKKYAKDFEVRATDSIYGNMYNKYLVELYTGILNNPERAESLSKKELSNRATPQTYSWYAWSLFCNNKKEAAYDIFKKYVSGKPLEGLELYWMGSMMKGLGKGYNAEEFFKAAYKNKYDLSPGIRKELENAL